MVTLSLSASKMVLMRFPPTCKPASAMCRFGDCRCDFGVARGARRDLMSVLDELTRAVLPRAAERKRAARLTRDRQRAHAGLVQILVQNPDRIAGDNVLRTGNRKG